MQLSYLSQRNIHHQTHCQAHTKLYNVIKRSSDSKVLCNGKVNCYFTFISKKLTIGLCRKLQILTSMLSVVGSGSSLQNQGGLLKVQQVLAGPQPSPSQRGSLRNVPEGVSELVAAVSQK